MEIKADSTVNISMKKNAAKTSFSRNKWSFLIQQASNPLIQLKERTSGSSGEATQFPKDLPKVWIL